jgi:hypothetical protein
MEATPDPITLDEVRERVRLAGLPIPEARLPLIHRFLRDALGPVRALDSRAVRTVEPAVAFDCSPRMAGPQPHESSGSPGIDCSPRMAGPQPRESSGSPGGDSASAEARHGR